MDLCPTSLCYSPDLRDVRPGYFGHGLSSNGKDKDVFCTAAVEHLSDVWASLTRSCKIPSSLLSGFTRGLGFLGKNGLGTCLSLYFGRLTTPKGPKSQGLNKRPLTLGMCGGPVSCGVDGYLNPNGYHLLFASIFGP